MVIICFAPHAPSGSERRMDNTDHTTDGSLNLYLYVSLSLSLSRSFPWALWLSVPPSLGPPHLPGSRTLCPLYPLCPLGLLGTLASASLSGYLCLGTVATLAVATDGSAPPPRRCCTAAAPLLHLPPPPEKTRSLALSKPQRRRRGPGARRVDREGIQPREHRTTQRMGGVHTGPHRT